MKTCFIFNPRSGSNRRDPWLEREIPALIASQRLDAEFVRTEAPGHATELARDARRRGYELVVAVGGDGTLNEVAQGLIGSETALGLVPCGSGNGLARHLGIPVGARAALALLHRDPSRVVEIDVGYANDHPFFNVMGIGFDAEISQRFNRLDRRGFAAYAETGLKALQDHRCEEIVIETNGRRNQFSSFLLTVANSSQYGNGALIAPTASVFDGYLNLVAFPRPTFVTGPAWVARLFMGNLDGAAGSVQLSAPHFTIEREHASGLMHTDGEVHPSGKRISVRVVSRALRVLLPASYPTAAAPASLGTAMAKA